uniref:Uncharacterized protein n=1 Tax=Anguilla anguilla TaxID=7936 RepID=A0A0E9U1F2_ANGAN
MGRTYEFCWQCLKEWKGGDPVLIDVTTMTVLTRTLISY